MVALIEDGKVTFSVIYDFVNDTMYHAVLGGGAYKNGERIYVNERDSVGAYITFEGDIHKEENMKLYLRLLKRIGVIELYASGYEFVLIATGLLEGRVCLEPFGHDYDYAPGSLLVTEAGGIVTNIGSDKYDYQDSNFIASNKSVHDGLTKEILAIFPG